MKYAKTLLVAECILLPRVYSLTCSACYRYAFERF